MDVQVAPGAVVVGVAPSPPGDEALRWAVREAQARHAPLALVRAWRPLLAGDLAFWTPSTGVVSDESRYAREERLLEEAAERACALAPELPVSTHLEDGPVGALLEEATDGARLVVLGGRDTARHAPGWLGPVPRHLLVRSCCPVVVVPSPAGRARRRVVVGLDGTELSGPALDLALDVAARWGAGLSAVLALGVRPGHHLAGADLVDEVVQQAQRRLDEGLQQACARYPSLVVGRRVALEHPSAALLAASRDADLVVVGSHGRGALRRAALGSVSAALVRSAPCPVAVVRPAPQPEEEQ